MSEAVGLLTLFAAAAATLLTLLTIALVRGMRHPHRRTVGYAIARNLACDPEERGLAYESWTLARPGGAMLAVWEVTGRRVAGPGETPLTAVFLHGWGQSRLDTLAAIEPWPDLVERLVLYDLRGHGESTGPSRVGIDEEDDLAALLEELGSGPFVLVGRSLGAGVAWRQAARAERVAGVMLLAPVVDLRDAVRRRLRRAGYPVWPILPLGFAWLRLQGLRSAPMTEGSAPRVPVLVVSGDADEICPPEAVATLVDAVPGAELRVVEGARHADVEAVDADGVVAAVRGFVGRVRGARGDGGAPRALGDCEGRG